ncbi:hypothetical protein PR202_gb25632 [Eleusine coracana subsp. coracana]|uniref:Uncharacterized protein n=1 Tax=Eleusine coracana subsp. coracana TaxID=191504 RepID=A0AAV5FPF6_ELECO|nr:hypothetical protein PR202_gb25632 [Eleusine coracana subsp. coracana]
MVRNSTYTWFEDLLFVASEPLDETLIILIEDRSKNPQPVLLGYTTIPVISIEERLDVRQIVRPQWFNIESPPIDNSAKSRVRIHLRLCLDGGYHVFDEAVHVCSDYRPTVKQLWKPPVGVLELGIISVSGLLPMKIKGVATEKTDAYCVAKYGHKWVYDCFTVLTVAMYDNWRMLPDSDRPNCRMGKRSEPPLRPEVVLSMLHEEDVHMWSAISASHHPKVNWFRIMMKALTWLVWLVQCLNNV